MAEQQPHRFPKPWQVFEDTESFGVADANGDSIAFVYYAEANRAAYFNNPKMMKDDARRIARIPELLEIEKRARGEMPDT